MWNFVSWLKYNTCNKNDEVICHSGNSKSVLILAVVSTFSATGCVHSTCLIECCLSLSLYVCWRCRHCIITVNALFFFLSLYYTFHRNFACFSLDYGNKCDRLATLVQCAEWLHFVCGWVQFFINLTKGKKAYSLFSVAAQCQLGVTLKHCSKAVCTVVFAVVEVGLNMGRAHN